MKDRYLEVTYRKGKPLAAYLYLPRAAGAKSVRTEGAAPGLRVDFGANGAPIGVEITAPTKITVDAINAVLRKLGVATIRADEFSPLKAA